MPGALRLLFNASRRLPARFLPPPPWAGPWHVAIDTAAPPPEDAADTVGEAPAAAALVLPPRSLLVLVTR